jgi:hypothetical protein
LNRLRIANFVKNPANLNPNLKTSSLAGRCGKISVC